MATDLPEPARRAFLEQLREQIGWTEYQRLVDRLGEDGVLEQALQAANAMGEAQQREKKKGFWDRYGWILYLVFLGVLALLGQWAVLFWWVLFFFALPLLVRLLQWVGSAIAEWWRSIIPRI